MACFDQIIKKTKKKKYYFIKSKKNINNFRSSFVYFKKNYSEKNSKSIEKLFK